MADLVDGVEDRGGPSEPALRMEALHIEEKQERTPLNNTDGDADSGVDESTQAQEHVEQPEPKRMMSSRIPRKTPPDSPLKRARSSNPPETRRMPRTEREMEDDGCLDFEGSKSVPKPPFSSFSLSVAPDSSKRVSMNKIVVGNAPSPNLLKAQSRIGSLSNSNYKPGGGQVKIEHRKLEWNATSKTKMVNEGYVPGGGDKKAIESRKLNWNAQSRINSLDKNNHRPGGGDIKIENRKLEWNVESKIGSTKNMKHRAGGGQVKIHHEKLEFKVTSRIGSLANVKHRPGGGEKKIFDDKEYIRQMSDQISCTRSGPGSLTGSIVGSSMQLQQDSGPQSLDLQQLSLGKHAPDSPRTTYKLQVARKMSPLSSGF
eukprot:GFUD01007743.1.p1 GENE.GFUD01007743.1~~GFUD01007743.1.p1  ORF type:complete len:372 (+),score=95.37 GFUD01007743.1:227-1342(+)